jgi:CheY-like chemotaxis protein
VLVVDDNGDAADSLALLVNLWGHRVRVCYDGPGALQLAREYQPDVVFLDLGLPGLSGYEVARRLRNEPALLVALTGNDPEQDGGRCQEAGFDLHLTKPVDVGVLQELLARLGRSPPSEDATSR